MSGSESCVFGPSLSTDATAEERIAYRRDVLKIPGPIDRWLISNSRSPHMYFLQDYLLFENVQQEYVDCFVESISVSTPPNSAGLSQPNTHLLYITAQLSPSAISFLLLRKSPRVLLDHFIGFSDALDAPEWTRWASPTLQFQQPKATFAALFMRMASWEGNREEPGRPYEMAQWVRSVSFGWEVNLRKFRPTTPRHSIRTVTNGSVHKNRNVSRDIDIDQSPLQSKSGQPMSNIAAVDMHVKLELEGSNAVER